MKIKYLLALLFCALLITTAQASCTGTLTITGQCGPGYDYTLTANLAGLPGGGAGFTLQWKIGSQNIETNGTSQTYASVGQSGNFTCVATNGSCQITSNTLVVYSNYPSFSESGSPDFCQGGSVTFTASAGTSYKWSTGATTQSIVATSSGNYNVTVTNNNGCSSSLPTSAEADVNVFPAPPATISAEGPTTFCQGGSVILAVNPDTSYIWSNGQTTQTIDVSSGGTYKVTVTGENNCTASSSVTVNVNPTPAPRISASGPTIFCQGGSVTLTATGGGSYLWSNGDSSQTDIVNGGGEYNATVIYTVTVTGADGCTATADEAVYVHSGPSANAGAGGSICSDTSTGIKLGAAQTAIGGTPPYTYSWSPNTGLSGSKVANPKAHPTSTTVYTVTVTDQNKCSAISSATVAVGTPVSPSVSISDNANGNICSGNIITFTATAVNGGSAPGYQWYINGVLVNTDTFQQNTFSTPAVALADTNLMEIEVALTSNAVCANPNNASNGVILTVNSSPTATITASGTTTTCSASVKLTAPAGTSYKYKWSNGLKTQTITAKSSGSYSVTVTNRTDGCTAVSSPEVIGLKTLSIPPIIYTNGDSSDPCFDPTFTITVAAGKKDKYDWSTGATTQAITVPPGDYFVTVTNTTGCSASESISATCPFDEIADKTEENGNDGNTAIPAALASNNGFDVSVYPNPYTSQFHLKVLSANNANINVKIFDITGKLLEERMEVAYSTDVVLGNGYAAGVYIVQVNQGEITRVLRIVKSE